jgi:hypothetical protein
VREEHGLRLYEHKQLLLLINIIIQHIKSPPQLIFCRNNLKINLILSFTTVIYLYISVFINIIYLSQSYLFNAGQHNLIFLNTLIYHETYSFRFNVIHTK